MDKLIERLRVSASDADDHGKPLWANLMIEAADALTQDRAAVLEEAADHFRKMAEGTVMGRGIIIDEVLSLKTPLAQAEPKVELTYLTGKSYFGWPGAKLYERRYSTGDLAMRTPDTRNPAEADRRKSALGGPKGDMKGPRLYELGQGYGRRAGDRARWVGERPTAHRPADWECPKCGPLDPCCDHWADPMPTPPAQAPEGLVAEFRKACGFHERVKWYTVTSEYFEIALNMIDRRTGGSNE